MASIFRRSWRQIHSTAEAQIPPVPPAPPKRRHLQSQLHAQIAFGANLTLMAVGLPVVWNYVVKEKWEAYRKAKEGQIDPSALEAERLAIELMVNERRKERGLPPYPYHSYQYTLMDQKYTGTRNGDGVEATVSSPSSLSSSSVSIDTAGNSSSSFIHSSRSHNALWDHVEKIHKQSQSLAQAASSSTPNGSTKATVPVHASEDYIKASQAYFAAKGKLGVIKSMDSGSLVPTDSSTAPSCH